MENYDASHFGYGEQTRSTQYSHSEHVSVTGSSIVFHANAKFGTVTGKAQTLIKRESNPDALSNNSVNQDQYFTVEFEFSFIVSPEQPEPSNFSIESVILLEILGY